MNHLEFAAAESAALEPTAWERWADKVEGILGHSLDADEVSDGYSMDGAYEAWKSLWTPEEYAGTVRARNGYRHPDDDFGAYGESLGGQ